MYWVNFLHIYQPLSQSNEILKRVVNESYRPLFKGFLTIPGIKINLNINAGLTENLWKKGYEDVIKMIKTLAKDGKLEFTESSRYHAFLPLLPKEEILRQIKGNYRINKRYFGKLYKPKCFFPPEMAYSKKISKLVSQLGYSFIIIDEVCFNAGENSPLTDRLYFEEENKNLKIIFRERRLSNCLMSAIIRTKKEFQEVLKEDLKQEKYICTGIDGETFGHHRPGLEKTLLKILSLKKPKQIFISELPKYFPKEEKISPVSATWASSREDIEKKVPFYSWKDPKNKVHELQWGFTRYILKLAKKRKISLKLKEKIDQALASDHFFWASGEPWWSLEMIEKGAWALFEVSKLLSKNKAEFEKGKNYYLRILATAFQWQRAGKIEEKTRKYKEAVRIPFKERSFEISKEGKKIYEDVISLIKKKMVLSARKKNYERAILWRDAIWKLETKNDIYDLLHIVDLLRIEIPEKFKKLDPKLNELMAEYRKIKSGQPELRKI